MAHATTAVVPALSRSVRRGTDAFARWLAVARRGKEKGVHQTRVATRRLREAMPVLAAAGSADADAVLRDLRRLTRALGPVREMDVARAVLQDLGRRHQWLPGATALLDRHCERVRERRLDALLDRVDSLDAASLPARVDAVLASVDVETPRTAAAMFLVPRLRRRARALAGALDRAGTMYAVKPLHDVRLATKKLRYLLELGGVTGGAPVAPELRRLKALQTLLGEIHDLQVVQRSIQEVSGAVGTDRATARRLTHMDQDVERDCRERHARFLKIAPEIRRQAERLARGASLRLPAPRRKMLNMKLTPPARRSARTR